MDVYREIFLEGALSRVMPWVHELALSAHRLFGSEEFGKLALIGSIGALFGYAFLYVAGFYLRRSLASVSTEAQQNRTLKWQPAARYILPPLLLIASVPYLGLLAVLAAGFYRLRPWLAIPALVMGEALCRLYAFHA